MTDCIKTMNLLCKREHRHLFLKLLSLTTSFLVVGAQSESPEKHEETICDCEKFLLVVDGASDSMVEIDLAKPKDDYLPVVQIPGTGLDGWKFASYQNEQLLFLSLFNHTSKEDQVIEVKLTSGSDVPQSKRVILTGIYCCGLTYDKTTGMLYCCDYFSNTIKEVSQNGRIQTVDFENKNFCEIQAAGDKLYASDGYAIHVFDIPFPGAPTLFQERVYTNDTWPTITGLFVDKESIYWCEEERFIFMRPLNGKDVERLMFDVQYANWSDEHAIDEFIVDTVGDVLYYSTFSSLELFQCLNFGGQASCSRIQSDILVQRMFLVSRCDSHDVDTPNNNSYHEGPTCSSTVLYNFTYKVYQDLYTLSAVLIGSMFLHVCLLW